MSNKASTIFGNAGNTISSIGIGTSSTAKKNALEVMQNGDVYVLGVGEYDGTNYNEAQTLAEVILEDEEVTATALCDLDDRIKTHVTETDADIAALNARIDALHTDFLIETTYDDLVALRTAGTLVPGMQYRITDYICTTTATDTTSAEHIFDIIVTADSVDTLNNNARAVKHTGDTYFATCNLSAWQLKYTIDNINWSNTTTGKGTIYFMRDEHMNEAPYDFKNIKFDGEYLFDNVGVDTSLLGTSSGNVIKGRFTTLPDVIFNEAQDLTAKRNSSGVIKIYCEADLIA